MRVELDLGSPDCVGFVPGFVGGSDLLVGSYIALESLGGVDNYFEAANSLPVHLTGLLVQC